MNIEQMIASRMYTDRIAKKIVSIMKSYGVHCIKECPIIKHDQTTKRADVGSEDLLYGFEIKQSHTDMNSGYGMNVDAFRYGFIVVPESLRNYTFYYIHEHDHQKAGIMTFDKDLNFTIEKDAELNVNGGCSFLDQLELLERKIKDVQMDTSN